jgi:L-cysteate sulfo-lyase
MNPCGSGLAESNRRLVSVLVERCELKGIIAPIEEFPRRKLFAHPTGIERLERLEAALGQQLGNVRLFVKRDDMMGIGGGGNKLRKLEFLIGEALSRHADTIIAIGGRQSNFARLTAAVCARLGLQCELILGQQVPQQDGDYQESGNILLDRLFGVRIHDVPGTTNLLEAAEARAEVLRKEGKTVFVLPSGGSTPTGCLGYAACAYEIAQQCQSLNIEFERIVLANGSSGTHAGLAAGFASLGVSPRFVLSFSVLADSTKSRQPTLEKSRATLSLLNDSLLIDDNEIYVRGDQLGLGYGIPTESMLEAVRLVASSEGLLLDPVYSGKAFAGLLQAVLSREFPSGANVLFLMTGGTPALFAYRKAFSVSRVDSANELPRSY